MKDTELHDAQQLNCDALKRLQTVESSEASLQERLRSVEAAISQQKIDDVTIKEETQRAHEEEIAKLRQQVCYIHYILFVLIKNLSKNRNIIVKKFIMQL